MFEKILIANRGEIACRIIQTAQRLGIRTIAVYSDADENARHVRMADEAFHIGGAASKDSYLNGELIVELAIKHGAQAIHPGYGFLSENESFAQACEKADIKFIGPSSKSIQEMGLKDRAKEIMDKAGVPVVPGYQGKDQSAEALLKEAKKVGFPLLIKAVAGGGGKGMRLVESEKDFKQSLESCKREAKASFNNDHVLLERFIQKPRHVEVQVFGDQLGNAVHLYERDCSLQRRHQKVVEEAPAPGLKDSVRKEIGDAAVKAVKALSYENAGTIEFIMDSSSQEFYFMEMNTRLQVEHPVSEFITGQDLVEWQLRVAAGDKLPLEQKDISINGHAFEVRLYAEDPSNEFLPQSGEITAFLKDDLARIDTGVDEGDSVTIHYDPMVAKIIVHCKDRESAIHEMQHALANSAVTGIKTNHEFLKNIFAHKDFIAAKVDTGFIEQHINALVPDTYGVPGDIELAIAGIYYLKGLNFQSHAKDPWEDRDSFRVNGIAERSLLLVNNGEQIELKAQCKDNDFIFKHNDILEAKFVSFISGVLTIKARGAEHSAHIVENGRDITLFRNGRIIDLHLFVHGSDDDASSGEGRIITPMPGKIVDVLVKQGDEVKKDQPLMIMEAMKMEMTIRAGCDGIIEELPVLANDQVQDGALLVSISNEDVA